MSWDRLLQDLRGLEGDPEDGTPRKIGKYDVVRELGRTRSSVLYLGRDPELGRSVAIKVLREDHGDSEFIRRFQREGAIAAALRHPNIITVHDVGVWLEGGKRETPYLVMDYVEGGTLAGRRLDPRAAAEAMATAAGAMAHAHAGGVIHRDLKPANILIDGAGRPIVTDFGLAKTLRGDSVATMEGSILGTPQYMAPEQVRGDSSKVDARTDVYALGAILYELLAGAPPYSDPNLASLFDQILRGEAPAPSNRQPSLPRALEAIALKAMQREPSDRYASAAALATDLRSFLSGGKTVARSPSTVRRVLRKGRPHARILAFAGLVVLLLVGWTLRSSHSKNSRIRDLLQDALGFEQSGELEKSREGYRIVLELDPARGEAQAGLGRIDTLAREAKLPNGPPPESAWKELGGSASEGGVSRTPMESFQEDLAIDLENRPVVVWRDFSGRTDDLYLRRWSGSEWVELGGSATGAGISDSPAPSRFPSLAIDPAGNPWVAWDDESGGVYNVRLKRWDGKEWTGVGGSEGGRGLTQADIGAGTPGLAIDAKGTPTVVWLQGFAEKHYEVFLRQWNGSSWVELGGSASGEGLSRQGRRSVNPSLALDPQGRPVVAWMTHNGERYEISCAHWTGLAWEGYGSVLIGGDNRSLGWLDDRCAVAVDQEGRPSVAWEDHSSGGLPSIYLKRWNGSSWVELGGSASGAGVSRGTGWSAALALTLDHQGNPVVAWWAGGTGNAEIYLRWWDGAAWREVGGSGSAGGISRTPAPSSSPRVRIDRAGNPVVSWAEVFHAKINDICVKRFEEFVPEALHQQRSDRPGTLEKGETVRGSSVHVQALLRSAVAGSKARLEVEVRPAGAPFEGTPTAVGAWVSPGTRVGVTISGLPPGPKRWRARTRADLGLASAWVAFGPEGSTDFSIPGPR